VLAEALSYRAVRPSWCTNEQGENRACCTLSPCCCGYCTSCSRWLSKPLGKNKISHAARKAACNGSHAIANIKPQTLCHGSSASMYKRVIPHYAVWDQPCNTPLESRQKKCTCGLLPVIPLPLELTFPLTERRIRIPNNS